MQAFRSLVRPRAITPARSLVAARSKFTLPELDYPIEKGVGPAISPKALDLHYNKHHQTYVNNANKLVTGTHYEQMTLEDVIRDTAKERQSQVLFNQTAQIWNHSFFWKSITPNPSEGPSAALQEKLDLHFGGLAQFKEKFSQNATGVFGSGWTWLVDNDGQLEIVNTFNAGTPLTMGENVTPLLTLDVWEHAYYVDHENRRPEFIKAFWEVVNWDHVEKQLSSIKRGTFE